MNKQNLVAICFVLMLASLFITPVLATMPEVTYDAAGQYTRYVGELGGAPYELFMPDNWNGHLVIGLKGFTTSNTSPAPTLESLSTHTVGHFFMSNPALVSGGRFAYAQSTYGVIGFCMQQGIIHAHQLTQYIIDNYDVSGQIYLIGFSMGGQIANMLVDKYPTLYAGVLDVCGNKDTAAFYNYWREIANTPADATAIRAYYSGSPAFLPETFLSSIPNAQLLATRMGAKNYVLPDVEAECGGTPESKPQAYDRLSPTCHPELTVPVLSIIARNDRLVPIQHFIDYYDAVQEAGCIDYYRSYTIIGAQHCDAANIAPKIPAYFMELFNWANGIQIPASTPKPSP